MINFFHAQIDSLSIHRIGNSSKGEELFLSQTPYPVNDEAAGVLKEYFFKPFREKEENFFRFSHDIDIEFNELYNICREIFNSPHTIHSHSLRVAQLLYEQSNHPHIKSGELYVCYLSHLSLGNEKVDAIGIFKSELKHQFLQFSQNESLINLVIQEGVNIHKLDKGCLIFNTLPEEGFKILTVDSNRYDAKYWQTNFLTLEALTDEAFLTKKYLKACQDFAKEVVLPAQGKQQEIMFMNRAVNHFAKNDEFEETNFINEVLGDSVFKKSIAPSEQQGDEFGELPQVEEGVVDFASEFKHFKNSNAKKYQIEDVSSFPIVNTAVSDARRKIKNTIELDTHIQIKMDFVNPQTAEEYIQKGWDQEKGMYFYVLYFNEELKS